METEKDYVNTNFILTVLVAAVLTVLAGFLFSGCATGKNTNSGTQKVGALNDSPVEVNPKIIAGVGNTTSETKTSQSAARDLITKINNDSKMITDLFGKNKEMTEKLIASNERTIYILIIQLCGLLTLFIKKDYDMDKRISEKDERIVSLLLKMITEEEIREDDEKKSGQ